ncbi:MAG: hypothetical protein U9P38_00015 [Campylobacterota bacterium]|nr:hypothetical protein [Campylobacterota bacterium]
MVKINWDEFKVYKKSHSDKENFEILLDFMRSYYSMMNPVDIFESLNADGLAQMMLEKRNITDAEGLEEYLFKLRS